MTIATPNLDDRRFQDLVDDAKRLVMERCPTWTDHNVSDPGVTLIETLRVHDRPVDVPPQPRARSAVHQVPRTDRDPPVPAHGGTHRRHVLALDAGVDPTDHPGADRVATLRGEGQDPVVFSTLRPLDIFPVRC